MTRIIITSDLHLGITKVPTIKMLIDKMTQEEPALTVIAGDIGEGLTNIQKCLNLFSQLPGDVAVLAGNHDVWSRENHSGQELWERLLPEAVQEAGLIWLETTVWRHNSTAVAGSMAWYDYSAADPTLPPSPPEVFARRKREYNNDAVYIKWPWSDPDFANQLGDALCERLHTLEADPTIHNILLVSHMPLFEEQMSRKPYDHDWGFSNAYFGNITLGQRIMAISKIREVISGHTHIAHEGIVDRPSSQGGSFPTSVIHSQYYAPTYIVKDLP